MSPAHGRVWRPANVPADWRPFTHGHWEQRGGARVWHSAFTWGRFTFGAGRWALDADHGWVWVPGVAQGPRAGREVHATPDLGAWDLEPRWSPTPTYCPIRARIQAQAERRREAAANPRPELHARDARTFTPAVEPTPSAPPRIARIPGPAFTPRSTDTPRLPPTITWPRIDRTPSTVDRVQTNDVWRVHRAAPRTVTSAFIPPRPPPPLRDTLAEARAGRSDDDTSSSWSGSDDHDSSGSSSSSSTRSTSTRSSRLSRTVATTPKIESGASRPTLRR